MPLASSFQRNSHWRSVHASTAPDSDTGAHGHGRQPALLPPNRRADTSSGEESRARRDHPRASARIGSGGLRHYSVDHQQPWGDGRAFRRRVLRDGSHRPEPDGEISHHCQPGPCRDDVPRAHARSQAADDLLLQGDLDGEQWEERWGGEPCHPVHHTRSRRAHRGSPSTTCAAKERATRAMARRAWAVAI